MLHEEAEALLLLEMHFELWKRRFSHLQRAVKQLSYLFFETYQKNPDCFLLQFKINFSVNLSKPSFEPLRLFETEDYL